MAQRWSALFTQNASRGYWDEVKYLRRYVKVRSGPVTGHLLDGVDATHVLWVILPIKSNGGIYLVIWAT